MVEDDLKYIFGDEWENAKRKIDFNDYIIVKAHNGFHSAAKLINEVILAKQGFIKYDRHSYVLSGMSGLLYDLLDCREKHAEIVLRACKVIERYMQEAHPELNLCLIRKDIGDGLDRMWWNYYYHYL